MKPAIARASARFDADFLTTDETAIEDKELEIALGVDVNRLRIIIPFVVSRRTKKNGTRSKKF